MRRLPDGRRTRPAAAQFPRPPKPAPALTPPPPRGWTSRQGVANRWRPRRGMPPPKSPPGGPPGPPNPAAARPSAGHVGAKLTKVLLGVFHRRIIDLVDIFLSFIPTPVSKGGACPREGNVEFFEGSPENTSDVAGR